MPEYLPVNNCRIPSGKLDQEDITAVGSYIWLQDLQFILRCGFIFVFSTFLLHSTCILQPPCFQITFQIPFCLLPPRSRLCITKFFFLTLHQCGLISTLRINGFFVELFQGRSEIINLHRFCRTLL